MQAAGRSNLKNVTLELGGKSPNIIFADADCELVFSLLVTGFYCRDGEKCALLSNCGLLREIEASKERWCLVFSCAQFSKILDLIN